MHPCILTHTIPIRPRRPARPEIHTYKHRTNSTSSTTASTIASWSQSCIYLHLLHNKDVILMHRRSPRPLTPDHRKRACMLVTTSGRDRAECPPSHPKRRRIRRAEGRGGGKGEGCWVVVGQRGHLDNPRRRVRIQPVQPLGRACAQLGLCR